MLNFSHHEFYNSNVDLLPIFGRLQGSPRLQTLIQVVSVLSSLYPSHIFFLTVLFPVPPNGFSFCFFPGFLAIFISSSNNNERAVIFKYTSVSYVFGILLEVIDFHSYWYAWSILFLRIDMFLMCRLLKLCSYKLFFMPFAYLNYLASYII